LKKIEQNSDFALFSILDPKARLRFEILFKKTHPRISLITLFLTKIYLLNTIKPFSSPENSSLTKISKPFKKVFKVFPHTENVGKKQQVKYTEGVSSDLYGHLINQAI
jgi:hypothetical protein